MEGQGFPTLAPNSYTMSLCPPIFEPTGAKPNWLVVPKHALFPTWKRMKCIVLNAQDCSVWQKFTGSFVFQGGYLQSPFPCGGERNVMHCRKDLRFCGQSLPFKPTRKLHHQQNHHRHHYHHHPSLYSNRILKSLLGDVLRSQPHVGKRSGDDQSTIQQMTLPPKWHVSGYFFFKKFTYVRFMLGLEGRTVHKSKIFQATWNTCSSCPSTSRDHLHAKHGNFTVPSGTQTCRKLRVIVSDVFSLCFLQKVDDDSLFWGIKIIQIAPMDFHKPWFIRGVLPK